jgi:hypothetical protein
MLVRGFTVDNNPDNAYVKETIRALEYTMKCGDIARRALKDIEEKGHYDGRVKIFTDGYGRYGTVSVRTIRQRNVIIREEWMPLSDLTVSLGKVDNDYHGSSHFKTSEITLKGQMYTELTGKKYEVGYKEIVIGTLRFLKSGLSFNPVKYGAEIVPIYKVYKHAQAQTALAQFANTIATQVVFSEANPEEFVTTELRDHVKQWLFTEGHSQRLMHEITQQAKIMEVLEA